MRPNTSNRGTPGIVLLCGRSFSGKSTLARRLESALPATVIALDAINSERGLISGSGVPVQEWERTHEIARDRTRTELRAGHSVIIDDTSSPRFLRDRWRDLGHRAGVRVVLLHLDTPLDVSVARHAANRSDPSRPDVADHVLHEHLSGFEPPEPDEHAVVVEIDSGQTVEDLLARMGCR